MTNPSKMRLNDLKMSNSAENGGFRWERRFNRSISKLREGNIKSQLLLEITHFLTIKMNLINTVTANVSDLPPPPTPYFLSQ